MVKKSEGENGKRPASQDAGFSSEYESAYVPQTFASQYGAQAYTSHKKRRSGPKIFGTVLGILFLIALLVYFAGVFVFMGRFFPNTSIGELDVSLKSSSEVQEILDELVDSYSFIVEGQGFELELTSEDVGVTLHSESVVSDMLEDSNLWAWPLELFADHDETEALFDALSATALSDVVTAAVDTFNESAELPQDAYVAYNESTQQFEIVEEVAGTVLDSEIVIEQIAEGVTAMAATIELTEDVLVQPAVFSDDVRLSSAATEANAMILADIELTLDGSTVDRLDVEVISSWITIDDEYNVVFDDSALYDYVHGIADECDTVGTKRTYTRPDGETITVSGGTYGWEVDTDELETVITDAISAGTVGSVAIPTSSSASVFATDGSKDWGSLYIDVSISDQHVLFYDESGTLIWESDCVTGLPNGERDTPTGVYSINFGYMASPETLVGDDYETEVTYWMPFVRNSVGFHDATWQSSFGGTRYKTNGSHGCVNLPLSAAKELYSLLSAYKSSSTTVPVIVHD